MTRSKYNDNDWKETKAFQMDLCHQVTFSRRWEVSISFLHPLSVSKPLLRKLVYIYSEYIEPGVKGRRTHVWERNSQQFAGLRVISQWLQSIVLQYYCRSSWAQHEEGSSLACVGTLLCWYSEEIRQVGLVLLETLLYSGLSAFWSAQGSPGTPVPYFKTITNWL